MSALEGCSTHTFFLTNEDLDTSAEDEDADGADFGYAEYPDSSDSEPELVAAESDSEEEAPNLAKDLADWATETKQTHRNVNALLSVLRKHGSHLPKDARTLLSTPRSATLIDKCNGKYIYFGLETSILEHITQSPNFRGDIEVVLNVDGVPIFKSSKLQFWPTLAAVQNSEPFLVALFCATEKPNSVEDYVQDLIEEIKTLKQNGVLHQGTVHKVKIKAFVCDAPARAFLKCTVGHNGLQGCERCVAPAVSVQRRVTYPSKEAFESRSDVDFDQVRYAGHQKKKSPLSSAGILCVKQFALDYMHLICLGVVKRVLIYLLRGPVNCRLAPLMREEMSNRMKMLQGAMPTEFAKQPRSLKEVDRWIARRQQNSASSCCTQGRWFSGTYCWTVSTNIF